MTIYHSPFNSFNILRALKLSLLDQHTKNRRGRFYFLFNVFKNSLKFPNLYRHYLYFKNILTQNPEWKDYGQLYFLLICISLDLKLKSISSIWALGSNPDIFLQESYFSHLASISPSPCLSQLRKLTYI